MTLLQRSPEIASAKLRACQELQDAWKADHEAALKIFDLEDLLGDMVELYGMLSKIDLAFRSNIANDPNCYDYELDSRLKSVCEQYLRLAEDIESTTLKYEHEYEISNLDEFQLCLSKARLSSLSDFDIESELALMPILPSVADLQEYRTPMCDWPE